jgi:hypothetical protein
VRGEKRENKTTLARSKREERGVAGGAVQSGSQKAAARKDGVRKERRRREEK